MVTAPFALALALLTAGGVSDPVKARNTSKKDSAAAVRAERRVPRAAVRGDVGAADSVVVRKSMRTLTLYRAGRAFAVHAISLGQQPKGAKQFEGDNRTPEGVYRIDWRNPNSRFHLALHIDYPRAEDIARARALGKEPGGNVMIHGLPPAFARLGGEHLKVDWTNGCVAVTNTEMEQLWRTIPDGTPIDIQP